MARPRGRKMYAFEPLPYKEPSPELMELLEWQRQAVEASFFDGGSCPQDKLGGCAIHGTACSNVNVLKSNYGHWSDRQKGAWYRHQLERA